MFCSRTDFGDHLVADPVVLPAEYPAGQEGHDRREVGLLVEFLVPGLHRVAAQQRGHRYHRQLQAGPPQVCGVSVDHLPPERIEVGFSGDSRRDRADVESLPQEPQFGCGEFLAGIADEEHRVGVRQQTQDRRQVRLALTADPGSVDESQPAFE